MGLSTTGVMVVLVGCAVVIGTVYVLYRRGVFGPAKTENAAPANSAKP